jgi:uncharacterized protein (TIGR03118 family)
MGPRTKSRFVRPERPGESHQNRALVSEPGPVLPAVHGDHFLVYSSRGGKTIRQSIRGLRNTVGSSSPSGPTGQVFNSTTGFTTPVPIGYLGPYNLILPSSFIFDTLQGTIEGWTPDSVGGETSAVILVNNSSTAEYTGLAAGSSSGVNYLYAANDLKSPGIQVYNSSFTNVTLTGNFVDPKLPKGFVPYNIVNVGGELFVTYRGGNFQGGAVVEFNTNGTFVRQIAANKTSGNLQSPWGLALAPSGFGRFSNDLIIGNFSSGLIDAYTAKGKFAGQIATTAKKPIKIHGLRTLAVGNGLQAGPATSLLFTSGIDGQTHGLLGTLQAVTVTK